MKLARFQTFCKKYGLDIGVYKLKSKENLPWALKKCSYSNKNSFSVIWILNIRTNFFDRVGEIESSFRYEETQINDKTLKQLVE